MEITLPISSFLLIAIGSVGVAVAVLLGVLLLLQRNKKHISVSLLGCLLILSGLTLLNTVLTTSGISNRIQQLYFIPIYYSLSIPPLFYLFVKSKFHHRLNRVDLAHLLIPFIQTIIYFIIGFRSVEFKSMLYNEAAFRIFLQIESFLFPIILVGYSLFALAILRRGNQKTFFWTEDIKNWLYNFAIGMLIIATIEFAFSLIEYSPLSEQLSAFPFQLVDIAILSSFAF